MSRSRYGAASGGGVTGLPAAVSVMDVPIWDGSAWSTQQRSSLPAPAEMHGYDYWSGDPFTATAVPSAVSGTPCLVRIPTPVGKTLAANVFDFYLGAAATTLTAGCRVGLYTSAGAMIRQSAEMNATWVVGAGLKTSTLNRNGADAADTSAIAIAGGHDAYIYAVILINFTGTPSIRGWATSSAFANANISAPAQYRAAQNGSGLTALPSSMTLASNVVGAVTAFIGLR